MGASDWIRRLNQEQRDGGARFSRKLRGQNEKRADVEKNVRKE